MPGSDSVRSTDGRLKRRRLKQSDCTGGKSSIQMSTCTEEEKTCDADNANTQPNNGALARCGARRKPDSLGLAIMLALGSRQRGRTMNNHDGYMGIVSCQFFSTEPHPQRNFYTPKIKFLDICGETMNCLICESPLPEHDGPGRPPSYCSKTCRRMAEYEIRRLQSRLSKLEAERDNYLAVEHPSSWDTKHLGEAERKVDMAKTRLMALITGRPDEE